MLEEPKGQHMNKRTRCHISVPSCANSKFWAHLLGRTRCWHWGMEPGRVQGQTAPGSALLGDTQQINVAVRQPELPQLLQPAKVTLGKLSGDTQPPRTAPTARTWE